jgi:hypothetical protein
MRAEDQYHVGIVVEDFEASLEQFSALFGYEWCDEVNMELPVVLAGDRPTTIEFRFRYSLTAPRIEVIESRAGTLWTPATGSGIHHLGFWSDDVMSDGIVLERSGYPLEAAGLDDDGARLWAYHRGTGRPRIELVSSASRPLLEPVWGG